MNYDIIEHKHRFAAWAACRAASTAQNCRFKVEKGKQILDLVGIKQITTDPDNLPLPEKIDSFHHELRNNVIDCAERNKLHSFTHGIAAKLINVYMKVVFTCGGYHFHPKVQHFHPPVDRLLLEHCYRNNIGKKHQMSITWSRMNSEQYQEMIDAIRSILKGKPLWMVEQYWQGYR